MELTTRRIDPPEGGRWEPASLIDEVLDSEWKCPGCGEVAPAVE